MYNACPSDVLSCAKNDVLYNDIAPGGLDKFPTTCSRSLKITIYTQSLNLSELNFNNY